MTELTGIPPPERVHATADRVRDGVERRLAQRRGVLRKRRVKRALRVRDAVSSARPLGARLHDQADRARRLEHAVRGRAPGFAPRGAVRRVLNQALQPSELTPGVAPERPQRAALV